MLIFYSKEDKRSLDLITRPGAPNKQTVTIIDPAALAVFDKNEGKGWI